MGTDLTIDVGTLYAFLLVLARISGAFIFVPIPGIQAGPQIARVLLSVSLTLALQPRWPVIDATGVSFPLLMGWMFAEAGMGLAGAVFSSATNAARTSPCPKCGVQVAAGATFCPSCGAEQPIATP